MLKIPATAPIVWTNESLNDINYGVFEVDIISFTPRFTYPKVSHGRCYYDKYDLEDMSNPHTGVDLKYVILRGYIWVGPTSTSHVQHIQALYKLKQSSTGSERDKYKLMLNSIYGNTITKTRKERIKQYKTMLQYSKALIKYSNRLVEARADNLTLTVSRGYDDKASYCFIECAILSMSRRIMNTLYDIAGDNLLYSDTDSLLIPTSMIPLFKTYIGDDLGQLAIEMDSTEAIILGYKRYLVGTRSEPDSQRIRSGGQTKNVDDVYQWFIDRLSN
jgi:hypothetical protein